jgi:hypothetical protein
LGYLIAEKERMQGAISKGLSHCRKEKAPAASNKIPKGISPFGGAQQNLPQDCSTIEKKGRF